MDFDFEALLKAEEEKLKHEAEIKDQTQVLGQLREGLVEAGFSPTEALAIIMTILAGGK